MVIAERLRGLREKKNLTQADIEKRTGLVRPYISRAENGHIVPSVETLEKFARALEVPLYQLFYDGEKPPQPPKFQADSKAMPRMSRKEARLLGQFRLLLERMDDHGRQLLLAMAKKMAKS